MSNLAEYLGIPVVVDERVPPGQVLVLDHEGAKRLVVTPPMFDRLRWLYDRQRQARFAATLRRLTELRLGFEYRHTWEMMREVCADCGETGEAHYNARRAGESQTGAWRRAFEP